MCEHLRVVLAVVRHWRDAYGMTPRQVLLFNEPTTGNVELQTSSVQEVVDLVHRVGDRLKAALAAEPTTASLFERPGVFWKDEDRMAGRPNAVPQALWERAVLLALRPPRLEALALRLARRATVLWGGVLLGIGWLARKWGSVLEAGLSIASILYGSLLGVFLLGLLTRRTGEKAAIAGMLSGLAVMVYVRGYTAIAWTWYVLIGATVTFAAGWLAAFLEGDRDNV